MKRATASTEWIALALIMLLGAVLRLGWPRIAEFKADEAHIAELALDLAQGHSLPLQGIMTSVGLPKPPISIYLYAIPFALSSNPIVANLFTALLNVGAVALCWWLGRRYWGRAAGLAAALLFATSPWAVIYSRKIWEPNLMAPFALAYVATGLLGFAERRCWAVVAHLILLGLLTQIHYYGLLLAPLTVVLWWTYRRNIAWRAFLAGIIGAGCTTIPFLWYVAAHWHTLRAQLAGMASQAARWDGEAVRLWWMLMSGSHVHSLAGAPAYRDFLQLFPPLEPLHLFSGALATLGVAWLGLTALRQVTRLRRISALPPESAAAGVLFLWAVIPLLAMLRHSTPLYPHYLTILFPAPYLAAGAFLAWGTARIGHWRWPLWAATTVAALGQGVVVLTLILFVGRTATPGGFGVPLGVLLDVRDAALASGEPVVVIGPGDEPWTGVWVSVFAVLLRDTPHRFVDGRHAALLPAAPATLLVTPDTDAARAVYTRLGLCQEKELIPGRAGEERFCVSRWQVDRALDLQPVMGPRALDNGAEIIAYGVRGDLRGGEKVQWWLAWRVWKTPAAPQVSYHLFNHLLDAEGHRCAQADSATVPTRDWQPDDVVVQVLTLEIPADAGDGPFQMRTGMYSYPTLTSQPVLDAAGNPAADHLLLPLSPSLTPH